jgi:hypothetical protein
VASQHRLPSRPSPKTTHRRAASRYSRVLRHIAVADYGRGSCLGDASGRRADRPPRSPKRRAGDLHRGMCGRSSVGRHCIKIPVEPIACWAMIARSRREARWIAARGAADMVASRSQQPCRPNRARTSDLQCPTRTVRTMVCKRKLAQPPAPASYIRPRKRCHGKHGV